MQFIIPRHFGFCYGVENAIEISYKALTENPNKRIYLLSEMIHNPEVNRDLQERGIHFIMDTKGNQFIPWEQLLPDDIVIIPAFGTTLETEKILLEKGIDVQKYNTTCPFVEKVWKRSQKLGEGDFTVIVHGKPEHEETRATFSHSSFATPTLVIKDMDEAHKLGSIILGEQSLDHFEQWFGKRYSKGFDPTMHLNRIGVVNQTTMLATETQAIADYLRSCMVRKYGIDNIAMHYADTRDTLCYATNDNQDSTYELLKIDADLAIVVGGYNSSNTSHLVELCERKFPTYFIENEAKIISPQEIHHFDYHHKQQIVSYDFLKGRSPLKVVLTSGASCPDTVVDNVMLKILSYYNARPVEEVLAGFVPERR